MLESKKNRFLIILLLAILALGLRVWGLDKPQGFWFDELYSYYVAKQSFPLGILEKLYNEDFHAPLYFFVLHFWMKLLGTSDVVIRFLSVIFGVLAVPASYLAGKEFFNRRAGTLAALMISLNSLHIFYSQEVRFYSLTTLLGLLSLYFIARILKKPERKSFAGLIIANTLLLYTATISTVFIFIQTIMFTCYLFFENKDLLKKYITSQFITLALFLPYLPVVLHQADISKKALINPFSWAYFDFSSILIIIQNWFSPYLVSLYNNQPGYIYTILSQLHNPMFYILIGIPVLTGLFGIIYALKSTNSKVFPLLGLSIAFLVIEILMTLLGKFTLISRYTLLSFMIIILVSAYGITEIKSQKIRNFLIYSLIIVNLFFLIASPNSAPKIERSEGFKPVAATLHQYNLGKDDIIFMLYGGKILDKYFNNSQMLDFQLFDLYPIGSVSKLHYLVGTDLEKSINQGNASEKLKYYITSPTSSEYFQKYLEDNCFKKLKKGRYFAFVVTKGLYLYDGNTLEILSTNDNEYKKQPLLLMIYSKIAKDTNNESLANLKPVSIVDNGVWVIYIYQKD